MKRSAKAPMDDCLQEYLSEVADHKVLTREEEVDLFQRMESGDLSAREEIARCNLRFVIKVALTYRGFGVPVADLIQEGNIGLLQVIDKFDWRRGFRFSTYAAYYIRQEIQAAIHRSGSLIRLPVRKSRMMNKYNEVVRNYNEREGRDPSTEEAAFAMGVPVDKVEQVIELKFLFASLDAERTDDGSTMRDSLPAGNTPPPSDQISEKQTRAAVHDVLDFLNEREREVIELRYGFRNGHDYSLRKASKVVGLSQEGVRRVEHRALTKLRRPAISQRIEGLMTA